MFPGQSSALCEHGGVPTHPSFLQQSVRLVIISFCLSTRNKKQISCYFQAIKRFQRYGVCLDPTKKYTVLESLENHFLDHATELTKKGKKFTTVLDNIDWEIRAHDMREEHQNVSEHVVASSLAFDRVPSDHLPDNRPQKDIKQLILSFFTI